jgi:general secretion pathway protein G
MLSDDMLHGSHADEPSGQSRARRPRRAFTIIELLAVMTMIGALTALGVPRWQDFLQRAKVARAISDLQAMQAEIAAVDSLPDTLAGIGRAGWRDPWGFPYVYYKFPKGDGNPPGARKDRFLVPVNSTYDLYSVGLDGKSSPPFTAKSSQDDVVRASDGDYMGLVSKF